jgi:hypothetical protein
MRDVPQVHPAEPEALTADDCVQGALRAKYLGYFAPKCFDSNRRPTDTSMRLALAGQFDDDLGASRKAIANRDGPAMGLDDSLSDRRS